MSHSQLPAGLLKSALSEFSGLTPGVPWLVPALLESESEGRTLVAELCRPGEAASSVELDDTVPDPEAAALAPGLAVSQQTHLLAPGWLTSMQASHSHEPAGFLNLAIRSSLPGNVAAAADCVAVPDVAGVDTIDDDFPPPRMSITEPLFRVAAGAREKPAGVSDAAQLSSGFSKPPHLL